MMMNMGAAGHLGRRLVTRSHRRGSAAAFAALMTVMVSASCGGSSPSRVPPASAPSSTLSRPATSPPDSPTPASPRAAVITAYTGYKRALTAADDSQNRARARAILGPYLPSHKQVDNAVSAFAKLWHKHQIAFGVPAVRVMHVKINRTAAVLHTCEDTSQAGLKDTRTGQIIPGSQGKPGNNLITRLTYHHGWRVVVQTQLALPCSTKL
jgi:hypothetical protein